MRFVFLSSRVRDVGGVSHGAFPLRLRLRRRAHLRRHLRGEIVPRRLGAQRRLLRGGFLLRERRLERLGRHLSLQRLRLRRGFRVRRVGEDGFREIDGASRLRDATVEIIVRDGVHVVAQRAKRSVRDGSVRGRRSDLGKLGRFGRVGLGPRRRGLLRVRADALGERGVRLGNRRRVGVLGPFIGLLRPFGFILRPFGILRGLFRLSGVLRPLVAVGSAEHRLHLIGDARVGRLRARRRDALLERHLLLLHPLGRGVLVGEDSPRRARFFRQHRRRAHPRREIGSALRVRPRSLRRLRRLGFPRLLRFDSTLGALGDLGDLGAFLLFSRASSLLAFGLLAHEPRAFLAKRLLLGVDARAILGVRLGGVPARLILRHARHALRLLQFETLEIRHLRRRLRRKRRRRRRRSGVGVGVGIRTLLRGLRLLPLLLLLLVGGVFGLLVGSLSLVRLVAFLLGGGGGFRLLPLDELRLSPVQSERAHQRAADTPRLVILRLAALRIVLLLRTARLVLVPVSALVFVRVAMRVVFLAERPSEG